MSTTEATMEAISLKLPQRLLQEVTRCAQAVRMTRAEYIRKAIEDKNRETLAMLRAQRLAEVSRKVRAESMRVNAEFAATETDPDA